MLNIKSFLKLSIITILTLISIDSYPMLCPSNYKTIEIGDNMQKVIELCGAPDERSEYKEVINLSNGTAINQTNGIYSQNSNSYYSRGQDNSQQLNDTKEKEIIHTKLIYHAVQPSALIFENGILVNRELLYK